MDNELLSLLIEAISILRQRQSELISDSDSTKKEINSFQSAYAKETKLLQEQIDNISKTIDRLIREAISKIEVKDGVDGKDYDESVAKALLKAEINKLVKQRNLETGKIKSEVLQAVENIQVPKGDKGEDGKSVTDEQIQTYVSIWLDDNIESLKSEDGKRGIQGFKGIDGLDGISIIDAMIKNDYLVLTFSDDTEKRIKMPKQKVFVGGGGGASAVIAKITTKIIIDTSTVDMNNEFILVDCTNNNIELFLPNIVSEIKRFYIKRIDNTSNTLIVKATLTIDDAEQIEIFQYESIPLLATPTKYHIL